MDKKIGHVMKVTEKLMFNGKDFFWVQEENEVNHFYRHWPTIASVMPVYVMPLIECRMKALPDVWLKLVAVSCAKLPAQSQDTLSVEAIWMKESDRAIFSDALAVQGLQMDGKQTRAFYDFFGHPLLTAFFSAHPAIQKVFLEANTVARDNPDWVETLANERRHDWRSLVLSLEEKVPSLIEGFLQTWAHDADTFSHYLVGNWFKNQMQYKVLCAKPNPDNQTYNALVDLYEIGPDGHYLFLAKNVRDKTDLENAIFSLMKDDYPMEHYDIEADPTLDTAPLRLNSLLSNRSRLFSEVWDSEINRESVYLNGNMSLSPSRVILSIFGMFFEKDPFWKQFQNLYWPEIPIPLKPIRLKEPEPTSKKLLPAKVLERLKKVS